VVESPTRPAPGGVLTAQPSVVLDGTIVNVALLGIQRAPHFDASLSSTTCMSAPKMASPSPA